MRVSRGVGRGVCMHACTLMDAFTHQGIISLLAIILPDCTSFILLSFVLSLLSFILLVMSSKSRWRMFYSLASTRMGEKQCQSNGFQFCLR